MVGMAVPIVVFAGVSATVFFAFYAFWGSVNERATARVGNLSERLELAGITASPQEIVLTLLAGVAILWVTIVMLLHTSLALSLILLPLVALAAAGGCVGYVNLRIRRRLDAFIAQLEPATRLMGGGLRVGLGLRQALALVIDELPDPARHEFRRVIGQTNFGVSILDALDNLAVRMPCHEGIMLTRVFRVQSETGGDLARILDQLADTIKDRRQVHRKIAALTAEGKMSAWVLMLIPVGLGVFIVTTQSYMGHALLYTTIGHIVLAIVVGLETCAYLSLRAILRVDA
jgi:tight adherence protein B